MPDYVLKIIFRLKKAGFSAYAVGGCVRDTLLGRTPHDWDVASSAKTGEVAALFENTVPTGARYGTVTVIMDGNAVEVTTFRRDGEYKNARKPESVRFVPDLKGDLSRRDFTVNAMAMDENGSVTDLFGGREDLDRRLIRCVGDPYERFSQDALRMLRALRFAAQLGFEIEPETMDAIRALAPEAEKLSAQRVLGELQRTLDADPATAGKMMEPGLLARYFPSSDPPPTERLCQLPQRLRLPALAVMASNGAGAEGILRRLRSTARDARLAAEAESVLRALSPAPDTDAIRLALSDHGPDAVLTACAALGLYGQASSLIASGGFCRKSGLAVTGADAARLGLEGPAISAALTALAHAVTLGQIENTRGALLKMLSSDPMRDPGPSD